VAMNGSHAGTLRMDKMLSMRTECVAGTMEPKPSIANNTAHTQQHMACVIITLVDPAVRKITINHIIYRFKNLMIKNLVTKFQ